jgi:DNA-binding MarR family transcriptional regulator
VVRRATPLRHDVQVDDVRTTEELAAGVSSLALALRRLMTASAQTGPALARRLGLSETETGAVEHLMDTPMGPVELSRRLGLTSAAGTLLVRRLEETGHVVREPHTTDHRRVVVRPTPRSEQLVLGAVLPLVADLEAAAADLDEDQRRTVEGYLERVSDIITAWTASAPRAPDGG